MCKLASPCYKLAPPYLAALCSTSAAWNLANVLQVKEFYKAYFGTRVVQVDMSLTPC